MTSFGDHSQPSPAVARGRASSSNKEESNSFSLTPSLILQF